MQLSRNVDLVCSSSNHPTIVNIHHPNPRPGRILTPNYAHDAKQATHAHTDTESHD